MLDFLETHFWKKESRVSQNFNSYYILQNQNLQINKSQQHLQQKIYLKNKNAHKEKINVTPKV
jgi:hypothetical protein